MNKHIVIIGINYYPEDSAIGLYTTQKAEYLVEQGFEVSVITGFPYYPHWKISKEYNSKSYFFQESINGVKVFRSKQYVPSNPTFIKRVWHMITFTFGNFINLFKVKKPDIVISIIPFTTSSLLGWFLKTRYKCKLWTHIQDFEFEAAKQTGLVNKKSYLTKILSYFESYILKKSDVVSTISKTMLNKVLIKSNKKGIYLPNWLDNSKFSNTPTSHPYMNSDKFKILYSGNIGEKQDWGFFYRLCENLKPYREEFEIIVVGNGSKKKEVILKTKQYSFVKHFDLVPFESLSSLLKSTDLHILFQKTQVVDTVMPSKVLGMFASGKPSIITGNKKSELKSAFEKNKLGFYIDDNEVGKIIDLLMILKNDTKQRKDLGENAKKYVNSNFEKEKVLSRFIETAKGLI